MLYLKCVFKFYGIVNYELNVNKFYGIVGVIRYVGMFLNSFYFLDKFVGLVYFLFSEFVYEVCFNILWSRKIYFRYVIYFIFSNF